MQRILAARGWRCLALGVVLMMSAPGVTIAQEDGVHYDSDSPAGKEYVLPLEQARSQGTDSTGRKGGAPLFGEGIQTADVQPTGSSAEPGKDAGDAGAGDPAVSKSAGVTEQSSDRSATEPAVARAQAESGASGLIIALVVGAAVLICGFALSLLLSRHRRAQ